MTFVPKTHTFNIDEIDSRREIEVCVREKEVEKRGQRQYSKNNF
jgi:hypothetical protein